MDKICYMHYIEWILFIITLIGLFLLAIRNIKSIKKSIIITILVIPALYLSIEGTTQFLTTDATVIIQEVINMFIIMVK